MDKAFEAVRAVIFGVEQHIEFGPRLDQILLVGSLETFRNTLDQRMVGLGVADGERDDRRVRQEPGAERVGHDRHVVRCVDQAVLQELQHRIGAVQCEIMAAIVDEILHVLLRGWARHDIAGIADQYVRVLDRFDILIILENAHADAVILGEQFQDFEPGKVDVVILPRRDQHALDGLLVRSAFSCFGHSYLPMTGLVSPSQSRCAWRIAAKPSRPACGISRYSMIVPGPPP